MLIKDLLDLKVAVNEGAEYQDSADFTAELELVEQKLNEVKKIITSAKWENWMEATDRNFDVSVSEISERFIDSIDDALKLYEELNKEIMKAE